MNYIIEYVDDTGKEDFRLPQCYCGRIVKQYYEVVSSEEYSETESYIVNVICKECFEELINTFLKK